MIGLIHIDDWLLIVGRGNGVMMGGNYRRGRLFDDRQDDVDVGGKIS